MAGIVGNFIVGSVASRNLRGTVITISVLLAAILALFPVIGGSTVGGVSLLILWGLAFGGVPVSVQTWILRAAPQSAEAATALNTSVFNLAIALGALFGGLVADNVAIAGVLWFGAALAVLTSLAVARVRDSS